MPQTMPALPRGKVGTFGGAEVFANPIEPHTSESRWQTCNCKSCQSKRALILRMPGKDIDFAKYRRSDEKY